MNIATTHTITDETRINSILQSARQYAFEPESKHLWVFVHANAELLEAIPNEHPLKASLERLMDMVVTYIVVSTIGQIREYSPFISAAEVGETDELEALRDEVRAEQWLRAAFATERWIKQLRSDGSETHELVMLGRLRDVFLGLLERPVDETSGSRPEWVAYATCPGSNQLLGQVLS
jgi:hypothetical protein